LLVDAVGPTSRRRLVEAGLCGSALKQVANRLSFRAAANARDVAGGDRDVVGGERFGEWRGNLPAILDRRAGRVEDNKVWSHIGSGIRNVRRARSEASNSFE